MQKPKSRRHVNAANARWRAAEQRAEAERQAGIPDRQPIEDLRQPIALDLRTWGGRHLRIEPRQGYISARAIDAATGDVVECAALKTLLHRIADSLPRRLSLRRVDIPGGYTERDEQDAAEAQAARPTPR